MQRWGLLILLSLISATNAHMIDSCTEISSAGYYELVGDIEGVQVGREYCILISADNVVLNGNWHSISGSGFFGVFVMAKNVTIERAIISNYLCGVGVLNSTNVTVAHSVFVNNTCGVYFENSFRCSARNSTISGSLVGIGVNLSWNNDLRDNVISKCMVAMFFDSSCCNKVENTTIFDNLLGLSFERSQDNVISYNSVSFSSIGIALNFSNDNTIMGNNITSNNLAGVSLNSSNGNKIYFNNFINNTFHSLCSNSTTHFSSSEMLTFSYNGRVIRSQLGNYWDDYKGSDSNGDGIGDSRYEIYASNFDRYPLISPIERYSVIYEPWQRYDSNGNSRIEDNELITAIMDWLNGRLSDSELIGVILQWLR